MKPTKEQEDILQETGNLVVNACPGSGKTFVISKKINKITQELEEYQGIIAISYTNKSSIELKERCTKKDRNIKSSYFGTIHSFIFKEIIFKFYRHLIPEARKEISIEYKKIKNEDLRDISKLCYIEKSEELWKTVKEMIIQGVVPLEILPEIGLMVLKRSEDCQNYLKSRYKYIFIDEYQDCTDVTNLIFQTIVELGIKGVAVGDLDQAIFGDSDNLLALWNNENYQALSLEKNHRCNESIIQYSRRLMNYKYQCNLLLKKRVFHLHVQGNEASASKGYKELIEKYMKKFAITKYNDIAILTWSNRTAAFVSDNIGMSHRIFLESQLDKDNSKWSMLFSKILDFYFDKLTPLEFATNYFSEEYEKNEVLKLYELLKDLKDISTSELGNNIDIFRDIATLIEPEYYSKLALKLLYKTISNPKELASYGVATNDEIQIMTIHKSKGLEFRLVFQMDLNAWCFPVERDDFNEVKVRNLHYVALTRAKDAVVLFTTSKRTNSSYVEHEAYPSKYLYCNNLSILRKDEDMTGLLEHTLNTQKYYRNKVCNLPII